MIQLQEAENRQSPGATTWAADFLTGRVKAEIFWACGLHPALFMKRKRDERLK
jgi:hypothetical protein